jgi:hypothetical protein
MSLKTSLIGLLNAAASSGEVVTLCYAEGSRPGEARRVRVVAVSGDTVKAVELDVGEKTYKLAHVMWVEDSPGVRESSLAQDAALAPQTSGWPVFSTLAEYAAYFRQIWTERGWNVCVDDESLSVGTYFKNGKPRKNAAISLRYFGASVQWVWDDEAGNMVQREVPLTPQSRPWRVDSWRFRQGMTFYSLGKAAALFLAEVEASDPAQAGVSTAL